MPTFDDLVLSQEVELEQAVKRRERALAEVKAIMGKARQEGRARLTEEEDADVTTAMSRRAEAEKDIAGIQAKLTRTRAAKEAEDKADELMERATTAVIPDGQRPTRHYQSARIGAEERTYRPDTDRKGAQFLRDVTMQYVARDLEAEQRLTRHMQEERVERGRYLTRAAGDTNTGNWTGLVVPQYLTDMYAPATAALRPFADICNKHDLPADGMTVNISRITTASTVASQANEFDAVSATSMDDTLLTENVQTAAGQQSLSRQAIDRGTGIEEVTMQDLFKRYATNLDSSLINQATTGLSAVAAATAFTTGSPTGILFYPKVLGALAGVEAALLAQAIPSHIVMHSRRWYWLSSQLTSTWPLIGQPNLSPYNIGDNAAAGYNKGVRGVLPNGLLVVVDNNIATNLGTATSEDEAYVVAADECHLWEDPSAPAFIRAEQPKVANLAVVLVLFGYYAYTFRRYTNGFGKINGTGMTTPSF